MVRLATAALLASRGHSVDLLEKAPPGLYHLGGGETISWFEWARKIAAWRKRLATPRASNGFVERTFDSFAATFEAKLERLCREAVAQGFDHVKLKVGRSVEDDVRRTAIAREVIGPGRKLMIDANQVWEVPQAIAWLEELAFARVNPARARDFAKAIGKLAKTDAIDARMLAAMAQSDRVVPLFVLEAGREHGVRVIRQEDRAGQTRRYTAKRQSQRRSEDL